MCTEFTVTFSSDNGDYDYLATFRLWLSSFLQENLFKDVFDSPVIDVYYGPVLELLSFKEDA